MNNLERKAHDLAVAFVQDIYVGIHNELDQAVEDQMAVFLADYERAYQYFKRHLDTDA